MSNLNVQKLKEVKKAAFVNFLSAKYEYKSAWNSELAYGDFTEVADWEAYCIACDAAKDAFIDFLDAAYKGEDE